MVRLSDAFLGENKTYSLDLRQLATVHLSEDVRSWRLSMADKVATVAQVLADAEALIVA
jgi:hypothetical protein